MPTESRQRSEWNRFQKSLEPDSPTIIPPGDRLAYQKWDHHFKEWRDETPAPRGSRIIASEYGSSSSVGAHSLAPTHAGT